MNDTGAYLQFTCSHKGYASDQENAAFTLLIAVPMIAFFIYAITTSIFSSPSITFDNDTVWMLASLGHLLLMFQSLVMEFLWQFAGKEVMEISQEGIILRHQIYAGIGISRRYRADKIEGVFVSRGRKKSSWLVSLLTSFFTKRRAYSIYAFKRGKVAFNYGRHWPGGGPKTFRFGIGMEEDDAAQIVSIIHNRFPQYRRNQ